jgi:hypothetical protein
LRRQVVPKIVLLPTWQVVELEDQLSHSHLASARWKAGKVTVGNRFNGFA